MNEDRVICPICSKSGQRSRVMETDSVRTALHAPRMYDEEGAPVDNDPNVVTVTFRCSEQHTFARTRTIRTSGESSP